jgi:hypothetical protein
MASLRDSSSIPEIFRATEISSDVFSSANFSLTARAFAFSSYELRYKFCK